MEVAFIEESGVALADGVATGEQVITDGALYLEDGEKVAVQSLNGSPSRSSRDAGRPESYLANR